jgi:hypothetical protein
VRSHNEAISDELWQVVVDTLKKYDGKTVDESVRKMVERHADITVFDGGVFIGLKNEFDLFVLPKRRGKWNIRGEVTKYLATLAQKYDTAIVKIHVDNKASLRLADFFGFEVVGTQGPKLVMEKKLWAT